jgi:hypothetical protein
MEPSDLSRLAAQLDGVTERRQDGLLCWRYHGRLVARQLDDTHVVIRSSFDARDAMLRSFPETFTVSVRFTRHLMVVADLQHGDRDAIEEAFVSAWRASMPLRQGHG